MTKEELEKNYYANRPIEFIRISDKGRLQEML